MASFYLADRVPGPVPRASPDYLISHLNSPTLSGGVGVIIITPLCQMRKLSSGGKVVP